MALSKNKSLSCFKVYDIRGQLGLEINEDIAFKIGYATAKKLKTSKVVLGFDARETSPNLAKSVSQGIQTYGANVLNLGLAGTEEVYSAVANFGADAGFEVTASHNPINYNGMKIVKTGSQPLTDEEFLGIKALVKKNDIEETKNPGKELDYRIQARATYLSKILSFVNTKNLKPLKIVVNSGNGVAGPVIDEIDLTLKAMGLEVDFRRVQHEPDSSFPFGIPNPLLKENRKVTGEAVKINQADFSVAFDGDFDRCFFSMNLVSLSPVSTL